MRAGTSAARRRPQQGAPDDAGLGGKPLRLLSAKVRLVVALGAMALAAGLAGASSGSDVWTITTFAGSGVAGFAGDGGPALQARFVPSANIGFWGIAADARGNVYISDYGNEGVRNVMHPGRSRRLPAR